MDDNQFTVVTHARALSLTHIYIYTCDTNSFFSLSLFHTHTCAVVLVTLVVSKTLFAKLDSLLDRRLSQTKAKRFVWWKYWLLGTELSGCLGPHYVGWNPLRTTCYSLFLFFLSFLSPPCVRAVDWKKSQEQTSPHRVTDRRWGTDTFVRQHQPTQGEEVLRELYSPN